LRRIWKGTYHVPLYDGSTLEIPLTPLPGGDEAIALLMSNQCSFAVTEHLASLLAEKAAAFAPDCIAAIPTMSLEYAPQVAQKLGHDSYIAMGFSQKFWYDSAVYEEIRSSTSAVQLKRLYLDPHLLHRVRGKKVVVVDDVINTGASVLAAVRLLTRLGANVMATLVVLTEGRMWEQTMQDPFVTGHSTVEGIGHIPLFVKHAEGWKVDEATL
jgi:adenine/guanine phosphoribosyltransferase-like PRPP-binding protein